jgi:hypothetical protein
VIFGLLIPDALTSARAFGRFRLIRAVGGRCPMNVVGIIPGACTAPGPDSFTNDG